MEKIADVFLRTPYNYDTLAASRESGVDASVEPSLTHQSFAEEADINTIVKRFGLTGELPSNVRMPEFADFTEVHDFKTAMDAVARSREAFEAMPADVRARFGNDPAAFVDFCTDSSNLEEARKLGLVPAVELAEALVKADAVADATGAQ